MVTVEQKIYLCGGWNAMVSLSDMHILDLDTDAWSQLEQCTFDTSRWNHCAVAVWAVPDPKIFIFGGNSGNLEETQQGIYQNHMAVLDTGKNEFWNPKCTGDVPSPRSSSEMMFDERTHQLVCFGGWANQWFGDLCVLDVGEIVGPPYSVTEITPVFGAITGDTVVRLRGMNLDPFVGANATVRFACEKGFVDATGKVEDAETVEVTTPNFTKYGHVHTEVRIAIAGHSFTNSSVQFKFHSITDSSKTVAYGPGILPGGLVEHKSVFVIQSMDAKANMRDTGGDEFKITIKHDHDHAAHGKKDKGIVTKIQKPEIEDLGNGQYIVSYIPPKIGGYNIDVEFLGTFDGAAGPIRGSQFHAEFAAGVPETNNELEGPLVTKFIRDTIKTLDGFCRSTKRGLEKVVEPGDLDELIRVKENLRNVDNQLISNQYNIDTTDALLHFLKGATQNKNLDRDIASLDKVKVVWSDVQRIAPETKQAIVPETKAQAAGTQATIAAYEEELVRKVSGLQVQPLHIVF
jgi:dynein heavy chain